jgi:hypothetical protein
MVSNTRRFPWAAAIALASFVSPSGGMASEAGRAGAHDPAPSPNRDEATNRGDSKAARTTASARPVASATAASDVPPSGAPTYLPTGPLYYSAVRRPEPRAFATVCSFRHPVCVHTRREILPEVALGALRDLERAAALLFDTLLLPAALPDGRRGGSPAFDLYLVPPSHPALDGALITTARDDPEPSRFDRASAFALLRQDVTPALRRHLTVRALSSAIGWSVDAAEAPEIRESNAAYLAELTTPYGTVTAELIDDFQSHPERAVVAPGAQGPEGVALPWYLDGTLGSGIGVVPTALAMVAGQRTPDGLLRWDNEPDLFDALRATLKARTPSWAIADFWMEFAIARLFMGSRDDGVHFAETAFAGNAGRIRFDWSVPFASLPRRLSPERPIDPSGSTYVWIDLQGAPPQARLVFRAEWEAPVPFRWALVRVRKDGSEASRVLVTPQQKTTSAEKNLDALEGLAGVAVVGVNVGDLALDDPFDPDHRPYEPHGYVLTIAVQPP